ncbi:MAG: hypothetical protein HQ564_10585 [Candidatus Saganbacteria bacterium]|nr:hypothetical protein [Candidatus Saganbacteria bacterium]
MPRFEAAAALEIENTIKKLEELNQKLEIKMGLRKKELEGKCLELEDVNRGILSVTKHKAAFLASMSHEIQTPINSILASIDSILGGLRGEISEKTRAVLLVMRQNGINLLTLINDILDFAKIEAGKMKLNSAQFSVYDLAAVAVDKTSREAQAKGIKINTELEKNLPMGWGDAKKVERAMSNLISNAIKFTKEGQITIRAKNMADHLLFEIQDTGIGIPEDQLTGIFEEFAQLEKTLIKEYQGTGIGLALSRRLIEMQGGQIFVESELGKGSIFRFSLPLKDRP